MTTKKILIVIPVYNEELTVGQVIRDFHQTLPTASICVVNNCSTDDTENIVLQNFENINPSNKSGLIYLKENKQGKAYALKKAFYNFDFDYFVMVDGDNTYDAGQLPQMLQLIEDYDADIVVADRISNGSYTTENKRAFHNFGNSLITKVINKLYGKNLKDILSGYRVLSKDFVKNFPITCKGFEIETEMTLFALENDYTILEVPTKYKDRPINSFSKLNTYSDGIKILNTILNIFKNYKPLLFFGSLSIILFILCMSFGSIVIIEYLNTKMVGRFPTAILAAGLGILSAIFLVVALVLDTTVKFNRQHFELKKIKSDQKK